MSEPEKAILFDVTGPADAPERGSQGIPVQFNPTSLAVSLANTISDNERSGTTRATQYVDKSSSSLTVELFFDTSLDWEAATSNESDPSQSTPDRLKDVRLETKKIAEAFMFQPTEGDTHVAPKRCMFVWGSFSFVGVMDTFGETLSFFSQEGTPLRSTVSIKLTENRFQFTTSAANAATRDTPTLGNDSDPVEQDWRKKSMYNGVESPRMPSVPNLSNPGASVSASFGASLGVSGGAGISGGISGGIGGSISGGIGGGISGGIGGSSSAGFSLGASSSIGTNIPGAFSGTSSLSVRASASASASASAGITGTGATASANIGFD